jgi:hypothetical protein
MRPETKVEEEHMRVLKVVAAVMTITACTGAPTAAGTWTGHTTGEGSDSSQIRFIIVDRDGALTGQTLFEDPETHEFVEALTVEGDRTGNQLTWRTAKGDVVTGTIEGNSFRGTLTYPAAGDLPGQRYGLELKR